MSQQAKSPIAGNAPEVMKAAAIFKWDNWIGGPNAPGFAQDLRQGIRFTTLNLKEQSIPTGSSSGGPEKTTRRLTETIHELEVTEGMLNGIGFMHGGCTAYFIDSCSSIALTALDPPDTSILPSVSLNLTVTYHAPAPLGATLRFISTVIAFNTRVQTVNCEVWDITNNKLVATGSHIKMQRSTKPTDEKVEAWREQTYAGRLQFKPPKSKL